MQQEISSKKSNKQNSNCTHVKETFSEFHFAFVVVARALCQAAAGAVQTGAGGTHSPTPALPGS